MPVSSGSVCEVMFVSDLRIASSFSVMFAAIMLQFCIAPSQKSGTPVPSALSGFCSPDRIALRFSKMGASSPSYFLSSSRISFRYAASSVDTSSSSSLRAATQACTGSGRLLMNSSTSFSLSISSSSWSSTSPSSSPSAVAAGALKLKLNAPPPAGAAAGCAAKLKLPAEAGDWPFGAGVNEKGAGAGDLVLPSSSSTPSTPSASSSSSSAGPAPP
mmetsp:Transcript_10816/g.25919  ORF Transcript_10816/g.25919 Transcript_10816/m.25919 type:complete len:216 (-) Transcript_10816:108-755(-)